MDGCWRWTRCWTWWWWAFWFLWSCFSHICCSILLLLLLLSAFCSSIFEPHLIEQQKKKRKTFIQSVIQSFHFIDSLSWVKNHIYFSKNKKKKGKTTWTLDSGKLILSATSSRMNMSGYLVLLKSDSKTSSWARVNVVLSLLCFLGAWLWPLGEIVPKNISIERKNLLIDNHI